MMLDRRSTFANGQQTSGVGLSEIRNELLGVRDHVLAFQAEMESVVADACPSQQASARNLVDYLGLRQMDLRQLQDQLASVGLSSLGRSEGQVMPALDAVLRVLDRLLGYTTNSEAGSLMRIGALADGERDLAEQASDLLGPEPDDRRSRIMVTLDGTTLEDPNLIRDLIAGGMNCARINCAHDDADTWSRLAVEVHRVALEMGRPCLVDMD